MTRAEEFEQLRPLLFAIAYRILGRVTEAEDAVQESWLRYQATPTDPHSAKAFLSAVVTRISIDVLRSAQVRREEYAGPWFPEPLLTDPYQDPERSAELADSVSMAALLLLERLTPLERAVFVLREVFGFGFAEVARAVGRSEPACRQLALRARRHMRDGSICLLGICGRYCCLRHFGFLTSRRAATLAGAAEIHRRTTPEDIKTR